MILLLNTKGKTTLKILAVVVCFNNSLMKSVIYLIILLLTISCKSNKYKNLNEKVFNTNSTHKITLCNNQVVSFNQGLKYKKKQVKIFSENNNDTCFFIFQNNNGTFLSINSSLNIPNITKKYLFRRRLIKGDVSTNFIQMGKYNIFYDFINFKNEISIKAVYLVTNSSKNNGYIIIRFIYKDSKNKSIAKVMAEVTTFIDKFHIYPSSF